MRIVVTFAVEAEFAPWRKLRAFRKIRANAEHWSGGIDVHEAQIGDSRVWVLLTGIGIKSFDFAWAKSLTDVGIDIVLSSGLAGSLTAENGPEEIVVPRRVGTLRDANGVSANAGLVLLAERQGARLIDVLLTADRLIETGEEKSRLRSFAQAVDMESFHIMSEFMLENVPTAVIRAISDGSEEDLPVDFSRCLTTQGRVKPGELLKELYKRPTRVAELVRFGRQSRRAAHRLASFLDAFIQVLTPDILNCETTEATAS